MSGISYGSPVSSSNSNSAWLAKNGDDSTVGRVDLLNTLLESGASITNIQRAINSFASAMGITNAEVYNFLITWAADYVGAPNDTMKSRINALVAKLNGTTGHAHSGADGDGANIPSQNVSQVQLKAAVVQGTDIASIASTSLSVDVSSLMGAAVHSTGPTVKGWVTNAPYNKIILQDSTGADILHTPSGEIVYGRLTWAASVWTLTFYYMSAGVETAYAFQSTMTNVKWFSQVLVNPITDSGYNYDYMLFTPSTNATADVVDASPTQRGVVSTGTQSFSGQKTFTGNIYALNLSGTNTGDVTIGAGNGLSILAQALSLALASASQNGALSSTDWTMFNNKEPAITTLPASKGGTGSSTYTVGDILYSAVTNTLSKLGIGTNGQVLTVVAGVPAWAAASGGGGGGGGANWVPVPGAGPLESIENNEKVFLFAQGNLEAMTLFFKLPSSYPGAKQVKARLGFYSPSSTNFFKYQITATLVRTGVDAMTSVTNQQIVNTGDVLNTVSNMLQSLSFNLTDAVGLINAVAVSANDLIKVELKRVATVGTEDTADVRFIPSMTEIGT